MKTILTCWNKTQGRLAQLVRALRSHRLDDLQDIDLPRSMSTIIPFKPIELRKTTQVTVRNLRPVQSSEMYLTEAITDAVEGLYAYRRFARRMNMPAYELDAQLYLDAVAWAMDKHEEMRGKAE